MTIQECYKKMGADYEDVLKRLYSEGKMCIRDRYLTARRYYMIQDAFWGILIPFLGTSLGAVSYTHL